MTLEREITKNGGLIMIDQTVPTPETPNAANAPTPPAVKLPTNRRLVKFILLSLVTFGIYAIVIYCKISLDINTIAGRYDKRHTMFYIPAMILGCITFGIVPLVWINKLCGRIGAELQRRNLPYSFNAGHFWLWAVLGSFIFVGPFIFTHKFFKAMNLLAADYNEKG